MRATQYEDMGKYLRDIRESLNVTMAQASKDLHIKVKYLHDLENGNLANMPGKTYVRGYIKNYAEYLGLDSQEVLEEYEKLFGGAGQKFFVPESSRNRNVPSQQTLLLCFAGLVALYGYWYFGMYDHTPIEPLTIESISEKLSDPMDKNWESCLTNYNSACFLALWEKPREDAHAIKLLTPEIISEPANDTKADSNTDDKESHGN